METEFHKKRRKRSRYRVKLRKKEVDLERVVAKVALIIVLGDNDENSYEMQSLKKQKIAIVNKITRLQNIIAHLSPVIKTG